MTCLQTAWTRGVLTTVLVIVAGCGGGGGDDPMDAGADAAVDGAADGAREDAEPGGKPCMDDSECDDGVPCTRDFCNRSDRCRNEPDHGMCADDVYCNGRELCDPEQGCVATGPRACSDENVCTIDTCIEEDKMCEHRVRDLDGDGEADWHCGDGTDCDDMDARRGSTIAEVCDDGIDNDCDGKADERECGRPEHDTCADPLDVSDGGSFTLSNEGAASDYTLGCRDSDGRKDLVLQFTLEERKDVRIRATSEGARGTWIELRGSCDDPASAIECQGGFPAELRSRGVEEGTYSVIVAGAGTGDIQVEVEFSDATPPPENETCSSPLDVSDGGSFPSSLVDVEDDLTLDCGGSARGDLVYEFTLEDTRNVDISLTADTGERMAFEVRSTCGDPGTALRCERGTPGAPAAGGVMYSLGPGTYAIVAESFSSREVDFNLEVGFSAPTDPPPGDTCGEPLALPLGEEQLGTLSDKQDDLDVSCGFFYRDVVYSFELTERRDVTVEVDGGGSFMTLSLREGCSDEAMEIRCTSGAPARARVRNLPAGTYYAVVEADSGTGFDIIAETSEPTVSTEVSGNETCDTAYEVPAGGGLFVGDTSSMDHDLESETCGGMATSPDAVFRLELASEKSVTASTEGSAFDTVLHAHKDGCGSEHFCDDDGGEGLTSVIEETLGAGTWYFVVDGYGSGSSGEYTFELMVSDP